MPSRSVIAESSEKISEKMEKDLESRKKLSTTQVDADLVKRSESLSESQAPISSKTIIVSFLSAFLDDSQKWS